MKNNTKRGLLASAGALVTAVALALGGAAAAQAAPPQPVPTSSDVTITKYTEGTAPGNAANGVQVGQPGGPTIPAGATTLDGVRFDYYLVTGTGQGGANDIGTNAGQAYAAGLTAATAPVPSTATGQFPVTANGGVATVNAMPRGLYVVREAVTPAGYTPAAPFLLAVPLTNPVPGAAGSAAGWLDHIYVYPKNAKFGVDKSFTEVVPAADSGASADTIARKVGDDFKYTILGDLPTIKGITNYTVTDTRAATLALKNGNTSTVKAELVDASGTPLSGGAQLAASDYTASNSGNVLTVSVTDPAGLAKLNAAPAGAKLRVTYVATVAANAAATASPNVENTATVSVTNDAGTTTATDNAIVPFGDILIHKVSSQGTANLAGAVFRVYATQADANAGNANYLTVNGVNSWTTTAAGTVEIRGLLYSNIVNSVTVTDPAQYRSFYLVEITAPSGHQLLTAPVKVDVLGKQTAVAPDNSVQQVTTITNQANGTGFVLPLTGGTGTAILTIGGIVILALVLIVARRRRDAEASAE